MNLIPITLNKKPLENSNEDTNETFHSSHEHSKLLLKSQSMSNFS